MMNAPFDPAALAQLRLDNALALFDEFVAQTVKDPDLTALRGLERRFAEKVLIQPSYWSQLKSRHRHIGERMARQFEERCRKPAGWMDQVHAHSAPPMADRLPLEPAPSDTSSTARDDDERFIVGLVLSYYRRHPKRARQRLLDLLGEVLTPAAAPSSATAAGAKPQAPAIGGSAVAAVPHADTAAPAGGRAATPTNPDASAWQQASRGVAPLKRGR